MTSISLTAPARFRFAFWATLFVATPAAGQQRVAPNPGNGQAAVIAVPTLATEKVVETDAGSTWALANQIADLISADLKTTSRFIVADVKSVRIPSYPEVTAPAFPVWRSAGTKLLLSGFVNARSDGRLTIGCYVYDVQSGRELARQGFAVAPSEWRRAAHRCADAAYTKVTGDRPLFDSRIAYVAQGGRSDSPTKRLAVMDFDGGSHDFLTQGDSTVITPRWSPGMDKIAYSSFSGGTLHVRLVEVATARDGPLLQPGSISFAPAFSPDGEQIAFSMSVNGNTDIYMTPIGAAYPQRLTSAPSVDTSPGFSPDGRQIVFSSDRSGTPQLYVMDSDGANQRRISFGAGEYGSPVWSPDGKRIAFTNGQGAMTRIGVMNANGSDERIVSVGPSDEQPSWSPDSRRLLFQRVDPSESRTALAIVDSTGGEIRSLPTPMAATDPVWAGRQE